VKKVRNLNVSDTNLSQDNKELIVKISKNLFLITVLFVMTIGIFGCTRQAWYEGAKQGAENECRSQPPSEMDRCLERLNKKTYEDYEKERAGAK
jgi:hypothetical protein